LLSYTSGCFTVRQTTAFYKPTTDPPYVDPLPAATLPLPFCWSAESCLVMSGLFVLMALAAADGGKHAGDSLIAPTEDPGRWSETFPRELACAYIRTYACADAEQDCPCPEKPWWGEDPRPSQVTLVPLADRFGWPQQSL